MPTFIDESGDTGSIEDGGKPYFRLVAVWVPTHDDADRFRDRVRRLRHELGLKADYEFKYTKMHRPAHRRALVDAAMSCEFRFAVGSVDKTDARWNAASTADQHWACAVEIAALLRAVYCKAEVARRKPFKDPVVVDDNADTAYLAVVKEAFGGLRVERPLTGKVQFRGSKSDEMLPLADMVCGAFGDDDRTWYEVIAVRHVF